MATIAEVRWGQKALWNVIQGILSKNSVLWPQIPRIIYAVIVPPLGCHKSLFCFGRGPAAYSTLHGSGVIFSSNSEGHWGQKNNNNKKTHHTIFQEISPYLFLYLCNLAVPFTCYVAIGKSYIPTLKDLSWKFGIIPIHPIVMRIWENVLKCPAYCLHARALKSDGPT